MKTHPFLHMKIYTKESLIEELISIRKLGFVSNARHGNHGGIGNTLEDLLEIPENNLPIANAAEWELKTQRLGTASLTTLIHLEPSPRAMRFVPNFLLPLYGWKHQNAGLRYPETEMSFRQTIHGVNPSDRGFKVMIDESERKVLISFDANAVHGRHAEWLASVENRVGLGELNPQPYWGFDDLFHKAGTKLLNCFYVRAEVKKEEGKEFYHFQKITMLAGFSLEKFLNALCMGHVLVDFDGRTGHNHGTKFRLRQNRLVELYNQAVEI